MKLGKQFDIDISPRCPQLSGPAAKGTVDNFNDKINTSIPLKICLKMCVNDLILNSCVKMTEMFICEKVFNNFR